MRNLKILGLMLVAMLAMSAVAAVSASADEFTAEEYPISLTGEKDGEFTDQFTTTAGVVKCPEPKYSATVGAATPMVTVQPEYQDTGCTAFGFPATIDDDDCKYVFNVNAVGTTGDVDLTCTSGKELTVTANPAPLTTKCTVHVKPQNDIGGTVEYINNPNGTVTLEVYLNGIDYKHTAGTGVGACPGGSATNGTLVAKAIVKGVSDGKAKLGIFLS
jgi:hypothetical protein